MENSEKSTRATESTECQRFDRQNAVFRILAPFRIGFELKKKQLRRIIEFFWKIAIIFENIESVFLSLTENHEKTTFEKCQENRILAAAVAARDVTAMWVGKISQNKSVC